MRTLRKSPGFAAVAIFALALGIGVSTEILLAAGARQAQQPRIVDLRASDAVTLKASYFAAGKRGPGVLLLHQVNRDRTAWDDVARHLAAAGVNTTTLAMGGTVIAGDGVRDAPALEQGRAWLGWPDDIEAAFQFLVSQPDVNRDVIGVGCSPPRSLF